MGQRETYAAPTVGGFIPTTTRCSFNEPIMKTAADFKMANLGRSPFSYTVFSEQRLAQTIGNDLRDVYGDLTEASMPAEFLRLAAMLDDKQVSTGAMNRGHRKTA